MVSLRRVLFASTIPGIFALSAAACSDDERGIYDPSPLDASPESEPKSPFDSGARDSAIDGADIDDAGDTPDEAVVCEVEPCAVDIVAGTGHFCVLMSDKTVRCWGGDAQGQVGAAVLPDGSDASPVSVVKDLLDVTQVSAGGTTSCARLTDSTVKCWGGNDVGQLGLSADPATTDGDRHPTPSIVALPPGGAARVDVGVQSACAVAATGDVLCWGINDQAQLARTTKSTSGGPAKADSLTGKVVRTTAGMHTAFGVDDTGRIASWGAMAGAYGAMAGRVSSINPDPVLAFLGLDGVTSFAASPWHLTYKEDYSERGLAHACAIARGRACCWGDSLYSAMGFGGPFAFVRPTQVVVRGNARPQRVAVSLENTCLRMTDGSIQCAGNDARGQLGRSTDAGLGDAGLFSDVFTRATAFEEYALRLALSEQTTCVIVRGGKVMCWGGNSHGELGKGSTDDTPHPTPTLVQF